MKQYQAIRKRIDHLLEEHVVRKAPTPYLAQILRQVFAGGKRLRPVITLQIQELLQGNPGPSKADSDSTKTNLELDTLALIPELIHSASLIIDDLPSMDNDTHRRDSLTIHYQYGENVAQIVTLYLFSQVYCLLHENLDLLERSGIDNFERRRELILQSLSDNLGVAGAAHGQYLDTCQIPNNPIVASQNKDAIRRHFKDLLVEKTATFFEISFVLGYLANGGDIKQLDTVRKASRDFGLAFQISDDFQDQSKDAERQFCPNYVNHLGRDEAIKALQEHITQCKEALIETGLRCHVFDEIIQLIESRVSN